MSAHAFPPRRWATAPVSGNDGTVARELSLLSAHYERCKGSKGRWFTLQCAAEALHAFVAPRVVTTVLAIGAIIGVSVGMGVGVGAFVL